MDDFGAHVASFSVLCRWYTYLAMCIPFWEDLDPQRKLLGRTSRAQNRLDGLWLRSVALTCPPALSTMAVLRWCTWLAVSAVLAAESAEKAEGWWGGGVGVVGRKLTQAGKAHLPRKHQQERDFGHRTLWNRASPDQRSTTPRCFLQFSQGKSR